MADMLDRKPESTRRPIDLAPANFVDPVVESYKKDVDRTLLRENLKLKVTERFEKLERLLKKERETKETGESPQIEEALARVLVDEQVFRNCMAPCWGLCISTFSRRQITWLQPRESAAELDLRPFIEKIGWTSVSRRRSEL